MEALQQGEIAWEVASYSQDVGVGGKSSRTMSL
jgi:hypothetical protein